jgi:hypothetical protein
MATPLKLEGMQIQLPSWALAAVLLLPATAIRYSGNPVLLSLRIKERKISSAKNKGEPTVN